MVDPPVMTDGIALVIFDCDGVLIDSEVLSTAVLAEMLRARGLAIDHRFALEHFVGHPYPIVAGKIATVTGEILPESFETDYRTALLARFERDLHPIPEIEAVLDQLAVPYCAATSSAPERARRSLAITGLASRFGEHVFTGSMVECAKPAPDLFLLAASRMNVAPDRCLVIEDSALGVAAARAAGMRVWMFTGGSHLNAQGNGTATGVPADRIFDDMRAFFDAAPALRR